MHKLRYVLISCAASLVLSCGTSIAADEADDARPKEKPAPSEPEDQSRDPGAVKSVPQQAKEDGQYMAALKKCEALKGGEKQHCVQAAQRKYSRM